MIKKIIATLLIGTSILVVSCDRSNKVEESELQEKKIVSATVSATQVMDKMEIDLVGVPTTKTNLPKRYEGVIDVGQSFAPNFETIASLTPDLLIIDINFKDKVKEQVKQYEMNTYYFDTTSFTNFKASIIELGELLDKKDESGKVVDELGKSVEDVLKKGKKSNKKPKIAIVFGSAESYMLATDISYIGDLLNTIDVDNVTDSIDTIDSAYVNFSMEQIVEMNPDYILRLSHGDIEVTKKAFDEEFSTNPAWMTLDATKEGRVYDLDPVVFGVTANLSIIEAIEELGNIIYGE